MPDACTMITEKKAPIPAYSKSVSVRLNMRPGQTLNSKLSFFQPSRTCLKLGLTLEATPLNEVSSRAVYVLVNNWLNNDPCPPQQLKLGPQSSQYAEIAAILITLQLAASHNIKELLICTNSNYARLSFTCHLTGWKRNGFKTANNKHVKHQELFQASDAIVTEHDMKKFRGHSRQPGQDKDLNEQTDALAKAGALHGESWTFHALPPNPSVAAATRSQHATDAHTPASSHIAISPQFSADNLLTLQTADSSLQTWQLTFPTH